jgi:3-hydroxybutyryl-CoA dehydrogenase
MLIVINGTKTQQTAFLAKEIPEGLQFLFPALDDEIPYGDAYFDLLYEDAGPRFSAITHQPVFINAVLLPAGGLPDNFIRINAWPGFLERKAFEMVQPGSGSVTAAAENVLKTLQWPYHWTPDIPGMIAARVVATIINEAYFGIGDGISSRSDIDTAMKLGTNYPYGPFEWSEKIGPQKIYQLLSQMAERDSRYTAAPALANEVQALS